MTISATSILASSYYHNGELHRIDSLQLRYPRFIHSELMTHRVFSRNASSSRAVPVKKLIEDVIRDTAMPIHWGKNQPGMQAKEECDALIEYVVPGVDPTTFEPKIFGSRTKTREETWLEARDNAISIAQKFDEAGYHKQIVNRLLEPFSHINVLVTATEWDNFFTLRDHADAQPEIKELAKVMKEAIASAQVQELHKDQWHTPYITEEDRKTLISDALAIKCSVARCARVSYVTHEMKPPSIEQDLKLYDMLVVANPKHMSPAEHQAKPFVENWLHPSYSGNFKNFIQYRKLIETETDYYAKLFL